jgi:hypothetical protein
MKHTTTGILASATSLGVSLSGVNEILTCVSLVLGIAIASLSLFRLIKNQLKK